jgi:hypothetical protein
MFFKITFVAAMMFVAASSIGCATTLDGCSALGDAVGGAASIAASMSNNPNLTWRSYEMGRNGQRIGEGACAYAVERRRVNQPAVFGGTSSDVSTAEMSAEVAYRRSYERTMEYEAGRQGYEDARREYGRPQRYNRGW